MHRREHIASSVGSSEIVMGVCLQLAVMENPLWSLGTQKCSVVHSWWILGKLLVDCWCIFVESW